MSECIQCYVCQSEATIHLTQIENNKVQKIDLCEECAKKQGVMHPEGFELGDLLGVGSGKVSERGKKSGKKVIKACEHCGFTAEDFKEKGRLGCGECYEALGEVVKVVLKDLHMGLMHKGKQPYNKKSNIRLLMRELKGLEKSLKKAIEEERFEDAAGLRDRIDEMKMQMIEDESLQNVS